MPTMELIDKQFPFRPQIWRSEGVHVSEVIHRLLNDLYGNKERPIDEQTKLAMEAGFMWEEALSLAWRYMLGMRPGELIVDGIALSPDGIKFDGNKLIVEEYKFTSISSNKSPLDVQRWLLQTSSYCYAVGTDTAEFHVLHYNGDYTRPYKRIYRVYRIQFGEQELKDNWEMIVNYAKQHNMFECNDEEAKE